MNKAQVQDLIQQEQLHTQHETLALTKKILMQDELINNLLIENHHIQQQIEILTMEIKQLK